MKQRKKNILIIGPLPPPIGGVSIHIKRFSRLIEDDFNIDFVDESHLIKYDYFNLRTFKMFRYLKKVRWADLIHIHSGKRQLVIFHIVVGRLLMKKILLTVHGYPNTGRNFYNYVDSFFYSLANRIIVVNSFILDRVRLPARKSLVRCAFVPPSMIDEQDLPLHLKRWLIDKKLNGKIIIAANAYQLKLFNSQDLYGLDLCIDVARNLVSSGYPVCFIYVVSSLEKNRNLYEKYQSDIVAMGLQGHFLLINEEISFVKLITYSDIILRPTNTDGDALTIREALFLHRPIIASDVIPRPDGTILFRNRDVKDLEEKIRETVCLQKKPEMDPVSAREYQEFYKDSINSVLEL